MQRLPFLSFVFLVNFFLFPIFYNNQVQAQTNFIEFESGQVRPLTLSPDGKKLFAVNTPDNRLEIFDVNSDGLFYRTSVDVGMEPIAVAARTNAEVWVVNHLSDSVSVVDVSSNPPRVVRTLLVGDEPRDIVFAGLAFDRAFITCAHRGQNHPTPNVNTTRQITPGLGRADVFVFDANNLGVTLGGTPLTIVNLFGDVPRALTATADGSTVYAAVFNSGNQTTTISEGAVCDGGTTAGSCNVSDPGAPNGSTATYPGGLPAPNGTAAATIGGKASPEVGLVVKYNNANGKWEDQLGRDWSQGVRFNLPDKDVFAINANANPPVQTAFYQRVGTTLFNMAVNPANGKVFVTNTEAKNEVRFEGPGITSTTVRGRLAQSRITVINPSAPSVTARHLNKHINYAAAPQPVGTKANSLATPVGIAFSADGNTVYVSAFGSSKIGVFNTAALENDTFTPSSASHISLTGGGPTGLVVDSTNNKLYVLTRFNNSVATVSLVSNTQVASVSLNNPESAAIVTGRKFLYDAGLTSSNGEASCSSCHIFGNMDDLAWDLGNPDDALLNIPFDISGIRLGILAPFSGVTVDLDDFHPMKGPMTTQTLRGMNTHGAMHWRGDRTGGNDVGGDAFDEIAAFTKFNGAFPGLIGRDEGQLSAAQMLEFANFMLRVELPPNPIRNLDNTLTASQTAGRDFYFGLGGTRAADGVAISGVDVQPNGTRFTCNGCHILNPAQGFFGTDGRMSFENETQLMKIAHLRNAYAKVGMFGMPRVSFFSFSGADNNHQGDQVRGFGYLHDGTTDTVFHFLRATVFNANGSIGFDNGDTRRRQVEDFILAFDSDLPPITGQQVTLTSTNGATVGSRISLLLARAAANYPSRELGSPTVTPKECDVTVKGAIAGATRSWRYNSAASNFVEGITSQPTITDAALRALVSSANDTLTYTCLPFGSGVRGGVDRDLDSVLDNSDNCAKVSNTSQADADNDGVGDACDLPVGFTGNSALALTDGITVQPWFANPVYTPGTDTLVAASIFNLDFSPANYMISAEVSNASGNPLIARGYYIVSGQKQPIESMPGFHSLAVQGNPSGPYFVVLRFNTVAAATYQVVLEAADAAGNKDTVNATIQVFNLVFAMSYLDIAFAILLAAFVIVRARRKVKTC